MRTFTDERGIEWRVFEMHRASLSEGSRQSLPEQWRQGWLVFENGVDRRRLNRRRSARHVGFLADR